jgi:hypothetical protein
MQRHIQLLKDLVLDSRYGVDEHIVAEAIIARAVTRRAVMGTTFRNDIREAAPEPAPQVRAFRPTRQARSFRPCIGVEDALIAPWRRG